MIKPPQNVQDQEYFLTQSIELAWKLITTVPPFLPHCPDITYDGNMHDEVPGRSGGVTPDQPLRYSKPILTNCTGQVYECGAVRSQDFGKSHLYNIMHASIYYVIYMTISFISG